MHRAMHKGNPSPRMHPPWFLPPRFLNQCTDFANMLHYASTTPWTPTWKVRHPLQNAMSAPPCSLEKLRLLPEVRKLSDGMGRCMSRRWCIPFSLIPLQTPASSNPRHGCAKMEIHPSTPHMHDPSQLWSPPSYEFNGSNLIFYRSRSSQINSMKEVASILFTAISKKGMRRKKYQSG